MTTKKAIFAFLSSLCVILSACSSTRIVNLRTESLPTPIGLDETEPYFSWQMSSTEQGACQSAYQLMVSKSEDFGSLVYDSGVVDSEESINIPYKGSELEPCTRYFWKVKVQTGTGKWLESDATWFETGLMDSGWSGAQWIGSKKLGVSKYRTYFNIDFDVAVSEGSDKATFVYSAKDADNYISVTLSTSEPCVSVDYAVEGDLRHQDSISLKGLLSAAEAHTPHHFQLRVSTPGYHLKSNLEIVFDGKALKPNCETQRGKPERMVITPYPAGERVHDWARLHSIGFKQPEGQSATFYNIVISENNWSSVLYTDPEKEHTVTGDATLHTWEPYGLVSAPMLRKEFSVEKKVKSARLYLTARGIYEFYINGQRVSNDYFSPGWTDFRYRIMYNAYDVTAMLCGGPNALGSMLGAGWFSDLNIFTSDYVDPYGISQSLLAKLQIQYEDGTAETIVTDPSWKRYDDGPIVRNGFQFGEDYDARKEVDGWKEGGFDDGAWPLADVFEAPGDSVKIQAFVGLPIQNNITLTAISVTEPVKGTFVYDFGQNIIGVPRLEGMKGESGQTVNLRYGEMIYPQTIPVDPVEPYTKEIYESKRGQVYTENYRGAVSIDNYIMRGDVASESYQPVFTDHGFRYVSVTGLSEALPLKNVKAVVLEGIGNTTSSFECSDANVNQLFQNIQWGQRDNFQAVPTDCPQRDERQGWTGDAQVFARTATYFSPWVDKFYARWFYSFIDNQGTNGSFFNYYPVTGRPPKGFQNDATGWMGWSDGGIIVPYQVYMQYGDIKVVEQMYPAMLRYMDFLESQSSGYLQPFNGIGDHLALEFTDISLTNSAYYAYDALMMSRMAKAIGREEDSLRFAQLYDNIKKAWNEKYVGADGKILSTQTQTAYALPLYFGLFNDPKTATAELVANIEAHGNTLTTGFIGTPYLNNALSMNGREDVAFTLFEQTKYPSWLYPVLQGATTMWERWNSYTIDRGFGPVDMNSFNHYAYGAIGEWMFSHLLGIQRDEQVPGYKHMLLQPEVGGTLEFAKGQFECPYGVIRSGWKKTAKGYIYDVTIPAGTTASLSLKGSSAKVLKGTAELVKGKDGKLFAELPSGSYSFEVSK